MTTYTNSQVLEAIKADTSHKLNKAHNTITGLDHIEGKYWEVKYSTDWGFQGTEKIRIEEEDGELEIW
jgi:hypothetical protein